MKKPKKSGTGSTNPQVLSAAAREGIYAAEEMTVDIVIACAHCASLTPNPLPGQVSNAHAALIAEACATQIRTLFSTAIRNHKAANGAAFL